MLCEFRIQYMKCYLWNLQDQRLFQFKNVISSTIIQLWYIYK